MPTRKKPAIPESVSRVYIISLSSRRSTTTRRSNPPSRDILKHRSIPQEVPADVQEAQNSREHMDVRSDQAGMTAFFKKHPIFSH